MAIVYVGIGSNREREKNVRGAITALQDQFGELTISSVYESVAIGFKGDAFYNLAASFQTTLSVGRLIEALKKIENDHGRTRTHQHGFCNRTLDIDVLLYDDFVGVFDGVELPRKEISENAFVLWPLAEIAGALRHPVIGKTFDSMWQEYDKNKQILKPIDFKLRV